MMTIHEMRARLDDLDAQIAPLEAERSRLRRSIEDETSRLWVAVNGVTLDLVQLSSGEGVPWHGHVRGFAEWMQRTRNTKPYAEWNGRVYLTADLCAGRMPAAPGLIEHVPEAPR